MTTQDIKVYLTSLGHYDIKRSRKYKSNSLWVREFSTNSGFVSVITGSTDTKILDLVELPITMADLLSLVNLGTKHEAYEQKIAKITAAYSTGSVHGTQTI